MMKILRNALIVSFFYFGIISNAQNENIVAIPTEKIDSYINEVYQENGIPIQTSNPTRYRQLRTLLENRVFFITSEELIEKALPIQAEDLFNKYNSDLIADTDFDIESLNPLKYNLPFWTTSTSIYRLGLTSSYLVVKGQVFK